MRAIAKAVGKISEVFQEGQRQKKWSAKRSDMAANGLTELNVILSFIAILPLCFTVFSKA